MMDPGATLQVQQNQIAGEMAKSMAAKPASPGNSGNEPCRGRPASVGTGHLAPRCCAQPTLAKNDARLETVIVTPPRYHFGITPDAIAHDVIRSIATPSALRGTISRWQGGLCPRTDGLSSQNLNGYVTNRIREIAAQAGAPLAQQPCKTNVEVVFTDDPQAVLDKARQVNSDALGYHPAAIISHAVQAWYETGATDIDGRTVPDREVMDNIEMTSGAGRKAGGRLISLGAPTASIEGWHGRPEVRSDILGVFIIADSHQTGSHALGPVADYVALLALSQTEAYESCQVVPSIANLLAPNCDDRLKPSAITASDVGFLRGVYKMMDPGASLQVQQNQIAGEMAKSITAKPAPPAAPQ